MPSNRPLESGPGSGQRPDHTRPANAFRRLRRTGLQLNDRCLRNFSPCGPDRPWGSATGPPASQQRWRVSGRQKRLHLSSSPSSLGLREPLEWGLIPGGGCFFFGVFFFFFPVAGGNSRIEHRPVRTGPRLSESAGAATLFRGTRPYGFGVRPRRAGSPRFGPPRYRPSAVSARFAVPSPPAAVSATAANRPGPKRQWNLGATLAARALTANRLLRARTSLTDPGVDPPQPGNCRMISVAVFQDQDEPVAPERTGEPDRTVQGGNHRARLRSA